MRILIKAEKRYFTFLFPTRLIINRFTALFISKALKKQGIRFTSVQLAKLIKALNKYRHRHKDWVILEVHSSDGEKVKIKI